MPYEKREKQRKIRSAMRGLKKYFQTASLYFQDIHPEISRVLQEYYNNIDRRQFEASRMVIAFQRGIIRNKKQSR